MNYTDFFRNIKDFIMETAKLPAWRFVLIWLLALAFLIFWRLPEILAVLK